jgi:3-oxoacyl-(acyl-carrier-protein) synthase
MGRVVVSGIGLVTGLAPDREGTWRRLVAGDSAIGPVTLVDITGFRTSIAAQVELAALGLPALAGRPRHVLVPGLAAGGSAIAVVVSAA